MQHEELKALNKEVQNYIIHTVHVYFDDLMHELNQMLELLEKNSIERTTLATKNFKAHIEMANNRIINSVLEITAPTYTTSKTTTSTSTTSIYEIKPLYYIKQLQLAVGKLQELKTRIQSSQKVMQQQYQFDDQDTSQDYIEGLECIVEFFKFILEQLRKTTKLLRLPYSSRFPHNHLQAPQISNHSLPPQLSIDIGIHRSMLRVDIFILGSTDQMTQSFSHDMQGKDFVGKTVQYGNHVVEVLEHAQVSMVLPVLDRALETLDQAIYHCIHVKENAEALIQCHKSH